MSMGLGLWREIVHLRKSLPTVLPLQTDILLGQTAFDLAALGGHPDAFGNAEDLTKGASEGLALAPAWPWSKSWKRLMRIAQECLEHNV